MTCKKLIIISALLCTFFISTWTTAKNLENFGVNLEKNLFKAVSEKDWNTVDSSIAPGFQSVHNHEIRKGQEAISYIKNLNLKNYTFNNFTVTSGPEGNTLVVTYNLNYAEKVGEQPRSGEGTKNLSVWQKVNGKWQWIAHAVED